MVGYIGSRARKRRRNFVILSVLIFFIILIVFFIPKIEFDQNNPPVPDV